MAVTALDPPERRLAIVGAPEFIHIECTFDPGVVAHHRAGPATGPGQGANDRHAVVELGPALDPDGIDHHVVIAIVRDAFAGAAGDAGQGQLHADAEGAVAALVVVVQRQGRGQVAGAGKGQGQFERGCPSRADRADPAAQRGNGCTVGNSGGHNLKGRLFCHWGIFSLGIVREYPAEHEDAKR
ncbi:protein of unknown function [Pseudomonas mediterranea]